MENVCKRRWYSLRDQYRKNLKKEKEQGDSAPPRRWKWKDELEFLIPFYKKRAKPLLNTNKNTRSESYIHEIEEEVEVYQICPAGPTTEISQTPKENQTQKSASVEVSSNSTEAFFKGIAAKVKQFSPYNRNIVESQIFNLVQKFEMSQILNREQSSFAENAQATDLSYAENTKTHKYIHEHESVSTKNYFEYTYNNVDVEFD
ncbi:unnamed protein product [Brassicogethes aeneus]|uniref:MADF domain-containing protein n=1 Tax=Brassicogethes aeneus TaxID=1431903 RepID=A0A9P0FLG6_BRAAE|nr:unnamed protein product [Brassicogethes aeneus]